MDEQMDRQTHRQNRSGYYSSLLCEQCGRAVKNDSKYAQHTTCIFQASTRVVHVQRWKLPRSLTYSKEGHDGPGVSS